MNFDFEVHTYLNFCIIPDNLLVFLVINIFIQDRFLICKQKIKNVLKKSNFCTKPAKKEKLKLLKKLIIFFSNFGHLFCSYFWFVHFFFFQFCPFFSFSILFIFSISSILFSFFIFVQIINFVHFFNFARLFQ